MTSFVSTKTYKPGRSEESTCRDISQLSSAGEERLFGSLDST